MPCFVSQNDARTSIWLAWSMNFNNSALREALLSWVIERSHYISLSKLCAQYNNVSGLMSKVMFAIYLHSSASHQSISLCLCSSHGINTNSPLSSRLRVKEKGRKRHKREKGKGRARHKKRERGGERYKIRGRRGFREKTWPWTMSSEESRNTLHHTHL